MYWIFEKVRGDMAIYGICPKCGFYYVAGSAFEKNRIGQYRYCPMCGEYLFNNTTKFAVIWDKRDIMDFRKIDMKS